MEIDSGGMFSPGISPALHARRLHVVPHEEMEHRLGRLRTAMRNEGHDALIVPGNADLLSRGYLRYVSDWRMWMGNGYFLLPLEGLATLILGPGSQGHWAEAAAASHRVGLVGDKADEIARILLESGVDRQQVGVVGLGTEMPVGDFQRLERALPLLQIVDATEMMQEVMSVKSEYEIRQASDTHRHVAGALDHLAELLEPGKTEREVLAETLRFLAEGGCVDGIAHITHGELPYIRPPTDRVLTVDDILKVQLEFAGPAGYWVELASVYSFRKPPGYKLRHFDTTAEALRRAAAALTPGARGMDVAKVIEDTFLEANLTVTAGPRWGIHGIGLNLVEPPFTDSPAGIVENMVIMISPNATVAEHAWSVFLPDNFVVTGEGGRSLGNHTHAWRIVG